MRAPVGNARSRHGDGVLVAVAPRDARGEIAHGAGDTISAIGGLLVIATVAIGCVQQAPLRQEVYGGAPPPAGSWNATRCWRAT